MSRERDGKRAGGQQSHMVWPQSAEGKAWRQTRPERWEGKVTEGLYASKEA